MTTIGELDPIVGTVAACMAIGIPRPTYYRWRSPRPVVARKCPVSCRALTVQERGEVLATLNSERFPRARRRGGPTSAPPGRRVLCGTCRPCALPGDDLLPPIVGMGSAEYL